MLGGSAGRRAQRQPDPFDGQDPQNRIHDGRLADTRPAGDDKNLGPQGLSDCGDLTFGKRQAGLPLDPRQRLLRVYVGPRQRSLGQTQNPLGDHPLGKVEQPPNRWSQEGGMRRRERTLFMRIRKVAAKAYDRSGVDLVKQILCHVKQVLAGLREHHVVDWVLGTPLLCLIKNIVTARNHFASLVKAGYPHTGFVAILDEICDEAARFARREIVQRLLHGRVIEETATEMPAALQKQIDDGVWQSAHVDLDEWLGPDVVPKQEGRAAPAKVVDLWRPSSRYRSSTKSATRVVLGVR
jgi:hypothetical protein